MWDHLECVVVDDNVWCIGNILGHYVGLFMLMESPHSLHAYEKLVIIACWASSECAARAAASTDTVSCTTTRHTFFFALNLARL